MKVLALNGKQNTSQIMIGKGLLKDTAVQIKAIAADHMPSRICIVTDSNVAKLYLNDLETGLSALEIPVFHHIIPAGEEYKNLNTVSELYDTLGNHQFARDDMVVALGGGVTGDLAGYAAATYMRGMRHLVQIPTTLLAQVDSSVGGKTGVDLPQGKNLVGAFRQPDLVIIDPRVLDTLTADVMRSGMAEVIKYGCIWDPEIIGMVSEAGTNSISEHINELRDELIERCVRIKIKVVEEDEKEEGLRRILNFGHTIGHGVEKLGNYTELSHGEAVSIGMVLATKMGENIGITRPGSSCRLVEILKSFGLPTETSYSIEGVFEAILSDKKKQGDSINFVLIKDFGKTLVKKIPVAELREIMKAVWR